MSVAAKPVQLGGHRVPVPHLVGPVGQPAPLYPNINMPAATALVDDALGKLAELRQAPAGTGGVTPQLLAMANAVVDYRTDRAGAIGGFQQAGNVGTPVERLGRVILPVGTTWPALFSYGKMASELEVLRDRPRDPDDYVYTGRFDHTKFLKDVAAALLADPATSARYATVSLPNFDRMLGFMEADTRIIDVRWMAYMFATAYWEAARVVTIGRRPDGRPIRQWETVAPVEETGQGVPRRYARPVKVETLGPTRARITEWDGDQFEVAEAGVVNTRRLTAGAAYNTPATSAYASAPGDEHTYYGRGYVQLTWWANYAAAGVAIGRGFDLLNDPELALDPDIAYKVMADGMITGRHYANTRQLQNYIYGALANYAGARAIVNAADPQPTIVTAAHIFERVLRGARS